jgi:hypothetical protein
VQFVLAFRDSLFFSQCAICSRFSRFAFIFAIYNLFSISADLRLLDFSKPCSLLSLFANFQFTFFVRDMQSTLTFCDMPFALIVRDKQSMLTFRDMPLALIVRNMPFALTFADMRLALFLGNVQQSLCEYVPHVLVVERVVYGLAVFAVAHESRQPELTKLVGHSRFGHAEQDSDVADAHLGMLKRTEYLDARRVGKHLEQIGQIVKNIVLRHFFADFGNNFFMNRVAVATIVFE